MVQTADQTSTAKDVPSCGQKSGGPAKDAPDLRTIPRQRERSRARGLPRI